MSITCLVSCSGISCEVHDQMDCAYVLTTMLSIQINMHLSGFSLSVISPFICSKCQRKYV